MSGAVGVVAIQGDFGKHMTALQAAGVPTGDIVRVRAPEDLALVERVILPGGESTTVGMLMQRFGLGEALIEAARSGMPVWGTCMGMILMAKEVEDRKEQYRLGVLDVTVRRNAFGAQVHSFETLVSFAPLEEPLIGVFIRAPVVTRLGTGVEVLAEIDGRIVAVRQGNLVGTSFHPELTPDTRVHRWFMGLKN